MTYGLLVQNSNGVLINSGNVNSYSMFQQYDAGVIKTVSTQVSVPVGWSGTWYANDFTDANVDGKTLIFARPTSSTPRYFFGAAYNGFYTIYSSIAGSYEIRRFKQAADMSIAGAGDYGLEVYDSSGDPSIIFHSGFNAARVKGSFGGSGSIIGTAGKLYGLLLFHITSVTGAIAPNYGVVRMLTNYGSSTSTTMSVQSTEVFPGYPGVPIDEYNPADYRYTNPTVGKGLILELP